MLWPPDTSLKSYRYKCINGVGVLTLPGRKEVV
jgi:hypothetical protein